MPIFQLYFLSLSAVIFLSYFLFGSGFNEWYVFTLSVVSVVNMIIFHLAARHLLPARGIFCSSSLFLISFAIVFFQFPILAPFYYEIRFNSLLWLREEFVNWTTMISAVSIHLFFVGYLWRMLKRGPEKAVNVAQIQPHHLRKMLLVFPVISIACFLVFAALVGPSYLRGAYAGSANWGGGASHAFRLFGVFFYLTLALDVYKVRLTKPKVGIIEYFFSFNLLSIGFAAFFVLFNLFTGDRGPILSTLLILAGGYDFFFKRINFFVAIAAIVFGIVVLSFISDYRSKDASETFEQKVEEGKRKKEAQKFYEYTGDLASSVRIMNYAVMLTPKISDHYFGWIQAGRLATTVPLTAGVLNRAVPIRVHNTPLGSTSSSVFTFHILGPNSQIGVGTSILADLYLDFGLFGCFLGMLFFGYFIGWVELRSQTHMGMYQVVFYLLVVSTAIYWPRSFIGFNFQSWFLSILVLYFAQRYVLRTGFRRVNAGR